MAQPFRGAPRPLLFAGHPLRHGRQRLGCAGLDLLAHFHLAQLIRQLIDHTDADLEATHLSARRGVWQGFFYYRIFPLYLSLPDTNRVPVTHEALAAAGLR